MAKRPVKWGVTRQPDYSVPSAITENFPNDKYVFGYFPQGERRADTRVAGAEAALDASGKIVVDVPSTRDVDFAYRYTLEGDVEDVSRQHIANRASVTVHPAPWYIGLQTARLLRRRRRRARASTSSRSIIRGTPVPNVAVTVSLVHIQWNSIRHAQGGGFYTWETERLETPAGEWTMTSAATPQNLAIPVPEGGYYEIHAVAKDTEGHATRTDTFFYGLGKGYTAWERFDHNRITIEPEKKTWKPGDKARVMIQSPWETATALMTVEREGVRRYERFDADVHAADGRGADHRGGHSERVRFRAAHPRPDVEGSGRGRQRPWQAGVPARLHGDAASRTRRSGST